MGPESLKFEKDIKVGFGEKAIDIEEQALAGVEGAPDASAVFALISRLAKEKLDK